MVGEATATAANGDTLVVRGGKWVPMTASNPQTGEKLVYRGGKWQPMTSGNPGITPDWVARRVGGAPVIHPAHDPFIHMGAKADQARKESYGRGDKHLLNQQQHVNMARETLGALTEFEVLNDRIRPTGGVLNRAANYAQENILGSADHARMTQLQASMARLQRQPGEGAVSDYEGQLFMRMVGGYDKPYATNRAYAAATRAIAQRRVDMHRFQEAYLQSNGTLQGWDNMWNAYRNSNPVLDRKGNARRVPSWQQFFANEARNLAAGRNGDGRPKAPPRAARNSGWAVEEMR